MNDETAKDVRAARWSLFTITCVLFGQLSLGATLYYINRRLDKQDKRIEVLLGAMETHLREEHGWR